MATLSATAPRSRRAKANTRAISPETVHRILMGMAACAVAALIVYLVIKGYPYYRLRLEDRPSSPLHALMRSSGTIGLRLGIGAMVMFGLLFLYPLRKQWPWLSRIGSTRRWLNFHILLGVATPIVATFHTSFRANGLAGAAYWTMIMVALSGFVGRYLYAKIPRSRNAAELSMAELEAEAALLAANLREQPFFREEDLAPLLSVPDPQSIRRMSPLYGLWLMLCADIVRPLRLSGLRRHRLGTTERVATLGGLLASHDCGLEAVVDIVQRQSRLRFSIAMLHRTERVFHLWHVVHRPFSISFIVLIAVHIAVALSMGGSAWRIH